MGKQKGNDGLRQRKSEAKEKADGKTVHVEREGEEVKDASFVTRFASFMYERDDAAFLAAFRIMWGFIMAYEAWTYIADGYAKTYYAFYNSAFHFKYWGFTWTDPPANPQVMFVVMWLLLLSGVGITVGFMYRLSCIAYFVLFTYLFTLEQGVYLNHFYLVCVMSLMIIFMPCHSCYSLDSWLFPKVHSNTCPKLAIWTVRALLVVVYFYAGVAKINEDWLRAEPLIQWLAKPHRNVPPAVEDLLQRESTAYLMSYTGMLYDLFVGPMLLWRPTLWLAVAMTLFFHITNKLVMNIGIFPWFMIASTSFFFYPSWPRHFTALFSGRSPFRPWVPLPYSPISTFFTHKVKRISFTQWLLIILAVVFLLSQILIPLRLHLYDNDVKWTEDGHKFAWRMKLRTKKCIVKAFAYQPNLTDDFTAFSIPIEKFVPPKFVRKMAGRPDMIAQAANYFANFFAVNGHPAEIYFYDYCRLNGRPLQALVDPTVNLADADPWDIPFDWVTELAPLTEEEKKWFPWNFEWNFNWIKGHDPNRFKNGEHYAMWNRNYAEEDETLRNAVIHFFTRMHDLGKISDRLYDFAVNNPESTEYDVTPGRKKRQRASAPPKPAPPTSI